MSAKNSNGTGPYSPKNKNTGGKTAMAKKKHTVLELCAGAGGQSIGLEMAGFEMKMAVEIDKHACETLRTNRPNWNVVENDIKHIDAKKIGHVDLLAGGVPCPPFSIAGKQLGKEDERDLFPEALRFIKDIRPSAVLLENVKGFANGKFAEYRNQLFKEISRLGYKIAWKIINAADCGVPQLRPRFVLVALKPEFAQYFQWPGESKKRVTVYDAIGGLMIEKGWNGGEKWKTKANTIAPTLVGGSKKHGGADLGPTRARMQWAEIGIDGRGLANEPPESDLPENKMPRLTLRMAARIQGFPDSWLFSGGKTAAYKQVGNAFPPPVAFAVGRSIMMALRKQGRKIASKGQQGIFGPFEPIS